MFGLTLTRMNLEIGLDMIIHDENLVSNDLLKTINLLLAEV